MHPRPSLRHVGALLITVASCTLLGQAPVTVRLIKELGKEAAKDAEAVAFSADGTHALVAYGAAVAEISLSTGLPGRAYSGSDLGWAGGLGQSADGAFIVLSCQRGVRVWNANTAQEERSFPLYAITDQYSWIRTVTPDGRYVVTDDGDGQVDLKLWEVASGRVVRTFKKLGRGCNTANVSPDGNHLVLAGRDGGVALCSVNTGSKVRTMGGKHTALISDATFSPDSRYCLTSGGRGDGAVKLWDVSSGMEILAFQGGTESVRSIAFSPDGSQILTLGIDRRVSPGTVTTKSACIKLWTLSGPKELGTVPKSVQTAVASDIDTDLPKSGVVDPNAFALIVANENYLHGTSRVQHALNDGRSMRKYLEQTVGIPLENIDAMEDATYGTMLGGIDRLIEIANTWGSEARLFFYYVGHGLPDEVTKGMYLLPTDASSTSTATAIGLEAVVNRLGAHQAKQVTIILDACFSGATRGEEMLANARGVAIKPKPLEMKGNIVVLSASTGDETAWPYGEVGHGLFTYFLLKKLQLTEGKVTYGDLMDYTIMNVQRHSLLTGSRKKQTPSFRASQEVGEAWKNWRFRQ